MKYVTIAATSNGKKIWMISNSEASLTSVSMKGLSVSEAGKRLCWAKCSSSDSLCNHWLQSHFSNATESWNGIFDV